MEALLQHLTSYGMTDLSFIIVNSREPRSRATIQKLTSKVSFPVYQETHEEQVWNVMEGGKDDMFIYDKCGRLTFFIPFPLSIIHADQPIVQAAVLSTYFQSPCGSSCESNGTFAINALDEDIPEEAIKRSNVSNELVVPEEDEFNIPNTISPTALPENQTTENNFDYYNVFDNNSTDDNITFYNSNDISQFEELFNGNATGMPETFANETQPVKEPGILSSLLKLLMGPYGRRPKDSGKSDNEGVMEGTSAINEEGNSVAAKNEYKKAGDEPILPDGELLVEQSQKQKACLGFDEKVCGEWSKKRLLQSQKCCASLTDLGGATGHHHHQTLRSCKNYGKKRCTKMQPIFKCCLKTELTLDEGEEGTDKSSEISKEM